MLPALPAGFWSGRVATAAAELRDSELSGDDPWQATGALRSVMNALIGPVRSAAQNFAVHVADQAREQHLRAFEEAARRRPYGGLDVRITEQTVMPVGGVVTTRDEYIPPASRPRRRWWSIGRRPGDARQD